jgi:hypothetical protein
VLADDFSLQERGITELADGVAVGASSGVTTSRPATKRSGTQEANMSRKRLTIALMDHRTNRRTRLRRFAFSPLLHARLRH